jgi:hypothetical protein
LSRPSQPESIKGQEVLARPDVVANGGWMSGPELLYEMSSVIPPGEAQRYAENRRRDMDASRYSTSELIAMGRRARTIRKINHYLERGVWVTDPPKLTRDHWAGHERWRIRALFPGAILMPDAAEELGVTTSTLDIWISKGLIPDAKRPPGGPPKSVRLVTPDLMEIYRRVADMKPPPNGHTWKTDPRTVWQPRADVVECPSCACKFTVELTVKPVTDTTFVEPAETDPPPQEPDEDNDEDVDDRLETEADAPKSPAPASRAYLAMRSGRILDESLIQRVEDAVRRASNSQAGLVDAGLASHGPRT